MRPAVTRTDGIGSQELDDEFMVMDRKSEMESVRAALRSLDGLELLRPDGDASGLA